DGGEYRAADSPVAGVAGDDAEPAPIALEGIAILPVADRERADDAEPRYAGEDLGGAERRAESVLHTGVGRRSPPRRSLHSGAAAVFAAAGLGAMAVDPEEATGDQRPRERGASASPPYR